jgi:heme-degrading monooxygenase HmoA
MIAVIFEVWPIAEQKDEYLRLASLMKSEVEASGGCLSVERFESLYEEGKLLSLQFWESEEALTKWRNLSLHRAMQKQGREKLFKDYRLRVANVTRDYSNTSRGEVPDDSKLVNM